jgi:hypothetical protein
MTHQTGERPGFLAVNGLPVDHFGDRSGTQIATTNGLAMKYGNRTSRSLTAIPPAQSEANQ